MHVERARLELARGEWDEAVRSAELGTRAPIPMRCAALTVLGRIAVRRRRPPCSGPAWELATQIDEMQRIGPVAAARAEQAWLLGDEVRVGEIAMPVYREARQLGDLAHEAELGCLLARSGHAVEISGDHPYALQAAGRWREAAGAWQAAGCPYEHAVALADSPEPEDLLVALGTADDLGATPLAAQVRARLRALGVARIPRGPVGETRANPAGLTAWQVDVLRLLGKGYTNAQIARQLVVSVRTVDSHVAAVLDKLGARDRRHAAERAAELGVLDGQDR
jgi:DNA-binding CsgD family transcriptional regulator